MTWLLMTIVAVRLMTLVRVMVLVSRRLSCWVLGSVRLVLAGTVVGCLLVSSGMGVTVTMSVSSS